MWKKITAYMQKWNMVNPGSRILVGFSGGADSTALLQFLWKYSKEQSISILAVHVNHGIRGEEALRDQRFCEAFCRERNIPFQSVCRDIPAEAKAKGISTEEAGREARYEIFGQYLSEGKADRVALAHHRNDQAETMLFRLMRGTGLRGLRGMEPVRGAYIRPFLCVTRKEIEQWLEEEGLSWVEDGSNQEFLYTRNRIRYQLLEPMEEIRPGAVVNMAKTAERLLELEDYLEQELSKVWEICVEEKEQKIAIRLSDFAGLHPAMQKILTMHCLEKLMNSKESTNINANHAEQICALARGRRGSRIMLPGGICAVLGYENLVLKYGYGSSKKEEAVGCTIPGRVYFLGNLFEFSLEEWQKNDEIPVNRYTKWFDYDKIKDGIVLRTREPGDYLANADGAHKKLKDYLIDCKVPREERDKCILLADGSHIIWVVGMRISEEYKITEQTRRILKVRRVVQGGTDDGETSY
jgi:tRNA(Ile)-lysidine synthase